MKLWKKNLILIILTVLIAVIPLIIYKNAKFSGTDNLAQDAITQINPNYKPWFAPLTKPANDKTEFLLFALQASIGTGIVCYILIRMIRKRKNNENN